MAVYRLSKSKIAAFEHCPKRVWLQIHRRAEGKFDEATLARFQFGHDVGNRARFIVPDGVLVDTGMDMTAALARTAELIAEGGNRPIFEGTFQHEDVLVRVDILQPVDGGWEAIEVKASTRVHAYQLADLATQIWVMRGTGLKIVKATIRHLIGKVAWHRPDIAAVMFCNADVTDSIGRALSTRADVIARAADIVRGPEPQREMGLHCYKPFRCEFRAHCSIGLSAEALTSSVG